MKTISYEREVNERETDCSKSVRVGREVNEGRERLKTITERS